MFISSLYKAREESGELFFFNAQSLYLVHNSYLINTYSMNHQHLDGTGRMRIFFNIYLQYYIIYYLLS